MRPDMCSCLAKRKETFEDLKEEYDFLQDDITCVKRMNISEEAKKLSLEELQKQINNVKERMHNYIDTL